MRNSAKEKFNKAGGLDGLKTKATAEANNTKEHIDKGIDIAKQKFEDAGGVDGLKDKGNSFVNEVKAGFTPNKETTGFKRIISRITNLWTSGKAGKISIITICLATAIIILNLGGGSYKKQNEFQNHESTNNTWGYSENSGSGEIYNNQVKTKKLGVWVCSQCGECIESKNIPHGRCSARKNAPHSWMKKGERQVIDTGQKVTIWQCRKCFETMQLSGGMPPSGIRCPATKNSPHSWEKIAEQ
jgi:ribosomal protein L37AE/L43A